MLRLLLRLYAFSLPFDGAWKIAFGVDTIFKPYRLLGIAVIALFGLKMIARGKPPRFDGYDKAFAFIFTWGLAMAILWYLVAGTGVLQWAFWDLTLMMFAFLSYLVQKNEMNGLEDAHLITRAFTAGTVASVAIYQVAFGSMTQGRFMAFFDNPNRLAVALTASIIFLVASILFQDRRRTTFWFCFRASILLLLGAALFFTGSRGALAALGLGLLVLIVPLSARRSTRGRGALRAAGLMPIFVLGGFVVSFAVDRHGSESGAVLRYQSGMGGAADNRLDIWEAAWNVSADHYFIGVGTAQYRYYHGSYVSRLEQLRSQKSDEHEHLGTHSDYLNLLASNGLLSLLLYLGIAVSSYRRLSVGIRRYAGPRLDVLASYQPLLIAMLVNGVTHIMFGSPDFWLFMALITGAAASVPRQTRRRASVRRPQWAGVTP